eukprot:COSAG06_NODE_8116_length_2269_cov_17.029032_2_plen_68_part_00
MVDAAGDPFEQLMDFEPGQEMGSTATSWEDTFGTAREPQLMLDEQHAISPVFEIRCGDFVKYSLEQV